MSARKTWTARATALFPVEGKRAAKHATKTRQRFNSAADPLRSTIETAGASTCEFARIDPVTKRVMRPLPSTQSQWIHASGLSGGICRAAAIDLRLTLAAVAKQRDSVPASCADDGG